MPSQGGRGSGCARLPGQDAPAFVSRHQRLPGGVEVERGHVAQIQVPGHGHPGTIHVPNPNLVVATGGHPPPVGGKGDRGASGLVQDEGPRRRRVAVPLAEDPIHGHRQDSFSILDPGRRKDGGVVAPYVLGFEPDADPPPLAHRGPVGRQQSLVVVAKVQGIDPIPVTEQAADGPVGLLQAKEGLQVHHLDARLLRNPIYAVGIGPQRQPGSILAEGHRPHGFTLHRDPARAGRRRFEIPHRSPTQPADGRGGAHQVPAARVEVDRPRHFDKIVEQHLRLAYLAGGGYRPGKYLLPIPTLQPGDGDPIPGAGQGYVDVSLLKKQVPEFGRLELIESADLRLRPKTHQVDAAIGSDDQRRAPVVAGGQGDDIARPADLDRLPGPVGQHLSNHLAILPAPDDGLGRGARQVAGGLIIDQGQAAAFAAQRVYAVLSAQACPVPGLVEVDGFSIDPLRERQLVADLAALQHIAQRLVDLAAGVSTSRFVEAPRLGRDQDGQRALLSPCLVGQSLGDGDLSLAGLFDFPRPGGPESQDQAAGQHGEQSHDQSGDDRSQRLAAPGTSCILDSLNGGVGRLPRPYGLQTLGQPDPLAQRRPQIQGERPLEIDANHRPPGVEGPDLLDHIPGVTRAGRTQRHQHAALVQRPLDARVEPVAGEQLGRVPEADQARLVLQAALQPGRIPFGVAVGVGDEHVVAQPARAQGSQRRAQAGDQLAKSLHRRHLDLSDFCHSLRQGYLQYIMLAPGIQ